MHAPLPLGRTVRRQAEDGRDGTGRRGATRKELHGEERETRAKAPDGTWTNPSQDGERPPREEWPIAMKILTGTAALAETARVALFIIVSSLPSFSLLSPVLQHPSPTFTIYQDRVTALAEVTLHEIDTRKVLQKIVRRRTWSDARR